MISSSHNNGKPLLSVTQENELARLAIEKKFGLIPILLGLSNINFLEDIDQKLRNGSLLDSEEIKQLIERRYQYPILEALLDKKSRAEELLRSNDALYYLEISNHIRMVFIFLQEIELQKLRGELKCARDHDEWYQRWVTSLEKSDKQRIDEMLTRLQSDRVDQIKKLINELDKQINNKISAINTIQTRIKQLDKEIGVLEKTIATCKKRIEDRIDNAFSKVKEVGAHTLDYKWSEKAIVDARKKGIELPKSCIISGAALRKALKEDEIERVRDPNAKMESTDERVNRIKENFAREDVRNKLGEAATNYEKEISFGDGNLPDNVKFKNNCNDLISVLKPIRADNIDDLKKINNLEIELQGKDNNRLELKHSVDALYKEVSILEKRKQELIDVIPQIESSDSKTMEHQENKILEELSKDLNLDTLDLTAEYQSNLDSLDIQSLQLSPNELQPSMSTPDNTTAFLMKTLNISNGASVKEIQFPDENNALAQAKTKPTVPASKDPVLDNANDNVENDGKELQAITIEILTNTTSTHH